MCVEWFETHGSGLCRGQQSQEGGGFLAPASAGFYGERDNVAASRLEERWVRALFRTPGLLDCNSGIASSPGAGNCGFN